MQTEFRDQVDKGSVMEMQKASCTRSPLLMNGGGRTIDSRPWPFLNVQLNELETHGFISKKIYPELPPKVEYSLTDLGQSLLPIIRALGKWGDDNQEHLREVIGRR